MKKITIASLTATALATPFISFAAIGGNPKVTESANALVGDSQSTISEVASIIYKLGDWALVLLGALASMYIIIAAFNYLTAQGDSKKLGDARSAITSALVAIVIGIVAKLLTSVVANIAGGINN